MSLRPLRRAFGRAWLRAFDWSIEGDTPDARKAVVVAAPHTSNWDLPFALAVAWALDLDVRWVGKHTLFRPAARGRMMRALGGIPVDRRKRSNAVRAIAEIFDEHDQLMLLVPPEGTRGAATRWKTGFYWIAVEAKVPIVLGFLDYSRRRGGFGRVLVPTGDIHADFARLREFYADVKGKYPDRQGAVALLDGVPPPSDRR